MSYILSFIPTISLIVQKTSFQKYEFELIDIRHKLFLLFNFHKIQSNVFQYYLKRMRILKYVAQFTTLNSHIVDM